MTLHVSSARRFKRAARLEISDKKVLTEQTMADRLTDIRCDRNCREFLSSLTETKAHLNSRIVGEKEATNPTKTESLILAQDERWRRA